MGKSVAHTNAIDKADTKYTISKQNGLDVPCE